MNTILGFFLLLTGAGNFFVVEATQEPPDRLERKPRPSEAKKSEEVGKPSGSPAEKRKDNKTETEATDINDEEDSGVVRERVAKNLRDAEKKLGTPDTGPETRGLQEKILSDIDKLIRRVENPPPSKSPESSSASTQEKSQSQQNQQQQKQSSSVEPKGSSTAPPGQKQQKQVDSKSESSGPSRKERREQQRLQRQQQGNQAQTRTPGPAKSSTPMEQASSREQSPMADGQPPVKSAQSPPSNGRTPDPVKDVWGHLPETVRQEVDQYYREQFMPKYRDLVKQYYSRLAEQPRKPRD